MFKPWSLRESKINFKFGSKSFRKFLLKKTFNFPWQNQKKCVSCWNVLNIQEIIGKQMFTFQDIILIRRKGTSQN